MVECLLLHIASIFGTSAIWSLSEAWRTSVGANAGHYINFAVTHKIAMVKGVSGPGVGKTFHAAT
jgi:uncharacterized Tic20 family protein